MLNEQWQTFEWVLTATISLHAPRLKPFLNINCASSRFSVVCTYDCVFFSKISTFSFIKRSRREERAKDKDTVIEINKFL